MRGGGRFLERPEVKVALDASAGIGAKRPEPHVRRAPHRPHRRPPTSCPRSATSTSTRSCASATSTSTPRGVRARPEWQAGSVDGFLAFLQTALRGDDADAAGDDTVELLTFHRAKGLEFDTVFVTGLERGLVPISHAKTSEALDEEQRLLYVALSRAERVLELSWARQRTIGARVANRSPSQWLSRVERAIGGADGAEGTGGVHERIADARAHVSKQKSAKREVPEADAPLFAALVEWRRKLSRASGAPAYVVFHDTTLAAIATARPRTAAHCSRFRESGR